MLSDVWGEITYTFPNINGAAVEVWELFHPILYDGCNHLSTLGLKLIHDSKRAPG